MKHIQYSKMNIQTKMIRFYFMLFVFALSRVGVNAQSSIREVLKIVNDCSFPYKEGKLAKRGPGCMLDNKNVIVPNRLYTDVQCAEYILADDYDTMPIGYAKFKLPDSFYMLVVNLGNNIDYQTDELVLVDKNYSKYKEKVYTYSQLSSKTYNLWDGNEQPVD